MYPRSLHETLAGTGICSDGAKWSIGSPASDRRTIAHEEGRDQDAEGEEGSPERHHVETGEGHVFGADLDGKKIVSEGCKGRIGEHEEHHQRAVHGENGQVVLGGHDAAGSADLREQSQAGDRQIRPDQVNAHQPGENHADEHGDQGEPIVLLADHFVVETEDVFADEALGRLMVVYYFAGCWDWVDYAVLHGFIL